MFPPLLIAALGAAVAYVIFKPEKSGGKGTQNEHESDSQDGGGCGGDDVHRLPGELPSSDHRRVKTDSETVKDSTTENATDSGSEKSEGKEKENGTASQIPKANDSSVSG